MLALTFLVVICIYISKNTVKNNLHNFFSSSFKHAALPYLTFCFTCNYSITKCVSFRGTFHSIFNYLQGSLQPVFPWVLLPSSLSQSSHILLGLSGLIILKQVRMFPTICCFMHPDSSRVKILAEFQFILCSRFYLVEGILLHRSFFHPSFIRIT